MTDLERVNKRRIQMIEKKEQEKILAEEKAVKEIEKLGLEYKTKTDDDFFGDCDSPDTMENGMATILYIIIMLVGAIFKDCWLIWIMATVIFVGFLNRHKK